MKSTRRQNHVPPRCLGDVASMVKTIAGWATSRRDVVRLDVSLTNLPPNDRVILSVVFAVAMERYPAAGVQVFREMFETTDRATARVFPGWIVDQLNQRVDEYRDFVVKSFTEIDVK